MIAIAAAIFLLLGSVSAQEFSCPLDGSLICIDGTFKDPADCSIYHVCENCQFESAICLDGNHFDNITKTCRNPYLAGCDPDNYPRDSSAFCVGVDGRVDGPLNPTVFPWYYVNHKFPYDIDTGYWQAPSTGTYFFSLSAGTFPGQAVNVSLGGTPYTMSVVRNSTHHDYDVISRDIFMDINMFNVIAVILETDTSTFGDIGSQTMFTGFNIYEYMDNVVAFYAVSDIEQTFNGTQTPIVFEHERINIGNDYNTNTGIFTAPVAGHYFFTYSIGAVAGSEHRSHLVSNREETHLTELWRGLGINTGIDTLSKSLIYYLDAGQSVWVEMMDGTASNTQSTLLSFGGFLYDPVAPTTKEAWFVRTIKTQNGPLDPMVFEDAVVNEGDMYSTDTNSVTVKTSGYYYMMFYSGVSSTDEINMQLITQEGSDMPKVIASIDRSNSYNNYPDCMGRSVMVHLSGSTTVRLRIEGTTTSYSDNDKQAIFSGFLLHSIDNPT